MDLKTYLTIRDELTTTKHLSVTLLVLGIDALLFISGYLLVGQSSWVAYLMSQVLFAIVFLHTFLILHECGHMTAAKKQWTNDVIGYFCSIFCGLSYYPWKQIHQQHHLWTGNMEKDPVFAFLKYAKLTNQVPWVIRFGWNFYIPISIIYQYVVYWVYPLRLIGHEDKKLLIKCFFSSLLLPVTYISLHVLFPDFVNFKNFALALLIYGILWELTSSPQHTAMPTVTTKPKLHEQAYSTRTTTYGTLIGKYLYLNFGYHTEHHLYPSVPWYGLEAVAEKIKPVLGSAYNHESGFNWNLSSRSQDIRDVLELDYKSGQS